MLPKLTICIPTYDRAWAIGEALESVISQATDEIEIVVSDNASTDNMPEVIAAFQQRFPRLHYFQSEQNVGCDPNGVRVVELASVEYCWSLGSDDQAEPGAIAAILKAIDAYPAWGGLSLRYVESIHDQ